ncbi:MAG: hypothetical protein L3K52_17000 [Candidatus Thiothrix sulfatifontis]|nr:MAG: hypothetical protein L3K52_17000 [Candidatus Thiothrix sulfatifontis]
MQFWQHFLLGVALATTALPANAISVVADDWFDSLPDTITNAGDYYPSTFTIRTNIEINSVGLNSSGLPASWELKACVKPVTNWIAGMLDVKRDLGSSSDSSLQNGLNYVRLDTSTCPSTLTLFKGTGDVNSIPLEFQISNFDVTDGNGTKNIEIEYQVEVTTTQ